MRGVVAGALFGVALFALDLAAGGAGFMGLHDPRILAEVVSRARTYALGVQLLSLAVLVVAGALFGAAGHYALGRRWYSGLMGAALGHTCMLVRSLALWPQLYSAHFYERGGIAGAFMVLVTDHVPPVVPALILALFGAVALYHTRRARIVVLALVLAAMVVQFPLHRSKKGHGPNVLLIAVDSLRPDRIDRNPALASIAQRGLRFDEAFVTQARTFPSFVTLLTGRWPKHHGIRHEFPSAAARAAIGSTLPSLLRERGWRTAALSDYAGEIFARTPLGFSEVEAPRQDLFTVVGEQLLNGHPNLMPYAATRLGRRLFPSLGIMAELEDPMALAERAAARLDEGGPFFITVFFSAPHTPYASQKWNRFADRDYRGPFRYLKQPLPQQAALPPAEARQVQALYDGAVAAVDDAVALLLRRLEEDGLAGDTIVVLLGDHGENLFDVPGRGMGHGDHLWGDFANHIPLVIADGKHRGEVGGIVRDVDLAPTLAGLLGVAFPCDGVDVLHDDRPRESYEESGLWLLTAGPGYRKDDRLPYPDLWHITEAAPDGDLFLSPRWEQPTTDAKFRALRTEKWKLVYQPAPDGVHWRLFDVVDDPEQRRDVAADHPDVVAGLRARLTEWMQQ